MRVLQKRSNYIIFAAICIIVALFRLGIEYYEWQNFYIQSYKVIRGEVVGVAFKHSKLGAPFETVYLATDNGHFCFWSYVESKNLMFHNVEVVIESDKVNFINWLGTKCANAHGIVDLGASQNFSIKKFLYQKIANAHTDSEIVKQLYLSLYLNAPVDEFLQNKITDYGLSAVLALSGLNVALLWGLIWLILSPFYSFFQSRYFPYRSKSLDIGVLILVFLLTYLWVIDLAPSFARAVLMGIFAFFLLQRGFKILSYESLFIAVMSLLAIFPEFIISIGFWLSVIAVWLIFVFETNVKISKWLLLALFPVWIWFIMVPIVHLIFNIFSTSQIISPIYNVIFDYFYPVSIILHLAGYGSLFDGILEDWLLNPPSTRFFISTPYWFGFFYILSAGLAAKYKTAFVLLNLLAILFIIIGFWHFIW